MCQCSSKLKYRYFVQRQLYHPSRLVDDINRVPPSLNSESRELPWIQAFIVESEL